MWPKKRPNKPKKKTSTPIRFNHSFFFLQVAQQQVATKGQGKGQICSVRQTNTLSLTLLLASGAVVGLLYNPLTHIRTCAMWQSGVFKTSTSACYSLCDLLSTHNYFGPLVNYIFCKSQQQQINYDQLINRPFSPSRCSFPSSCLLLLLITLTGFPSVSGDWSHWCCWV